MTFYAQFDHTKSAPQPVIGWYDTAALTYPNLPDSADLLELTVDQWNSHFTPPGTFRVNNGAIEAYTPPPPTLTLAQQAQAAMSQGLSVALTGAVVRPAATFPCDADAQRKIATVLSHANATGALPGAAQTFPMRDMSGTWHALTLAAYQAVAGGITAYAASLDLIADGNPFGATALPSNSVTLTV